MQIAHVFSARSNKQGEPQVPVHRQSEVKIVSDILYKHHAINSVLLRGLQEVEKTPRDSHAY